MSLHGITFHVTPVDLCIIFQCNLCISCIMSCGNKIVSNCFISASSSGLLWADDSNAHNSGKQLFCYSSNPLGYISSPTSTRLFSIAPASASTTSPPLQASTSPLLAAPGCSIPRCQELVPVFPHPCLPRDRELLLRKSACPATNVPTKKAAGCCFASPPCSCHHRNFSGLHQLHHILWCISLLL